MLCYVKKSYRKTPQIIRRQWEISGTEAEWQRDESGTEAEQKRDRSGIEAGNYREKCHPGIV
jgi:hypothetical protein